MARKRKPRRRMVHWVTSGFNDGSVTGCHSELKVSEKRAKEEGIYICPDGVQREYTYKPSEFRGWKVEQRVRVSDILSNRLNTRRAIRELILPELVAIAETLQRIEDRLDRIECSHADGKG